MGTAVGVAKGLVVGSALVATACGSTAPDAEPPPHAPDIARVSHSSGSRLRARVVEGDGVAVFVEWFDTELGIVCELRRAEDGAYRCLPVKGAQPERAADCDRLLIGDLRERTLDGVGRCANAGFPHDREMFATEELHDKDCEADVCAVCETRLAVFRPGPFTSNGECGLTRRILAEPVAASTFVAARFEDLDGPGRLAARFAVFDDGARQLFRLVDRRRNEECHPIGTFTAELERDTVCAPLEGVAWITDRYFTSCGGMAPVAYGSPCTPPTLAVLSPHVCGPTEIRSVGEEVAGTCAPSDETDRSFWRIGDTMPADTFARLSPRRMGSGRLGIRAWTDDNSVPLVHVGIGGLEASPGRFGWAVDELEDRERGFCSGVMRIGDQLRCIPISVPHAYAFADAACTEPVATVNRDSCAGGTHGAPDLMVVRTSECEGTVHAAEPWSGPLFRVDNGDCVPTTFDGAETYRAGPKLDPQHLAPIRIRQE